MWRERLFEPSDGEVRWMRRRDSLRRTTLDRASGRPSSRRCCPERLQEMQSRRRGEGARRASRRGVFPAVQLQRGENQLSSQGSRRVTVAGDGKAGFKRIQSNETALRKDRLQDGGNLRGGRGGRLCCVERRGSGESTPPRETDVVQFRTLPPARSRLHRSYFLEPPDEPSFHLPGPLAFEDLEEAIPSLLQERLTERENPLSHHDLLEVVQFPYPRD